MCLDHGLMYLQKACALNFDPELIFTCLILLLSQIKYPGILPNQISRQVGSTSKVPYSKPSHSFNAWRSESTSRIASLNGRYSFMLVTWASLNFLGFKFVLSLTVNTFNKSALVLQRYKAWVLQINSWRQQRIRWRQSSQISHLCLHFQTFCTSKHPLKDWTQNLVNSAKSAKKDGHNSMNISPVCDHVRDKKIPLSRLLAPWNFFKGDWLWKQGDASGQWSTCLNKAAWAYKLI